ncbi:caspase family protein [Pararoseomonas indoligenes]|uniref:Caspase family protein n=1 Tax=Roseomonas indoligenes TaxID=2820811 RepID=A0A940S3U9_9PROT|nr:caspase family protein [Pararoseomonas indoligenes]MBP0491309.1 caspase family protein [Pararoseomonas indoligenes]
MKTGQKIPALLLLVLALLLPCSGALAQRIALVIGNSAYQRHGALANAASDASGVAAALQKLGFQTSAYLDTDRPTMMRALREFGDRAQGAEVALVFYAGHGVQVSRGASAENYLLPVDARLADVRDVEDEAIGLERLLERLDGARTRIVILDACRDNPFAAQMAGQTASRGVSRGLARVETSQRGTLLVFSTEPGNVALDGADGASPFAAALIDYLPTEGIEVRQMLTRVRQRVFQATGGKQTPWSNDGLFNDVFLAGVVRPAEAANAPSAPDPGTAMELAFWNSIQGTSDRQELEAYLAAFPQGRFAALARARLERLGSTAAATSRIVGKPPVAEPALQREPLDRAGVAEAQRLLTGMGFETGGTDGVAGGRTQEAYRAWLSAAGRDTGEPMDSVTLAAMRDPPPADQRAAALLELGTRQQAAGQNAFARRSYDRARTLDPGGEAGRTAGRRLAALPADPQPQPARRAAARTGSRTAPEPVQETEVSRYPVPNYSGGRVTYGQPGMGGTGPAIGPQGNGDRPPRIPGFGGMPGGGFSGGGGSGYRGSRW